MLDRITRRLYDRLGSRYWVVLFVGEAAVSIFVALLTITVIAAYYDTTGPEYLLLAAVACALTLFATCWATKRARDMFDDITSWRDLVVKTPSASVAAWEAATTLTHRQYRRDSWRVNAIVVLPTCLLAVHVNDLPWTGFFVLLVGVAVPAIYATFMSYSAGEALSRPMVADIAASLPDDFPLVMHGLPVSRRVRLGLPTYTVISGLAVAAAVGDREGSRSLLLSVVVATAIGVALSIELATLLSRAITRPVTQVKEAMQRVHAGDYSARVPVMSSDELGELTHDFNRMARGLEEREEMRAAFGTYVDRDVVALILSGQFPPEGVEVDVSILFCDVRGFTSYAEHAAATEVVSVLNRLFEVIVPVIESHGGHVDKFIGDGLLAVFGAPEFFSDHADRAVAAACAIVAAVDAADVGLSVAAGVNSGRVVAGSVGGAGRLNFSVIGDAVNVAARVEAATRETGDDVLLTADTRSRLVGELALISRGSIPLKGKSIPVELYAPVAPSARAADKATATRTSDS